MNRIVESLLGRPLNQLRARREFEAIIRSLAVRAPVAFVGAGISVKDDDAVVEVSVGDEQFIGFPVHEQARGSPEVFGVVASSVFSRVANLHEELSLIRGCPLSRFRSARRYPCRR